MNRPTDTRRSSTALKTKADGGADFASLARDNSEAPDRRAPAATSAGSPRASSTTSSTDAIFAAADRQDLATS